MHGVPDNLIGIGLYTPAEAGRLVQISAAKINRWLRGHTVEKKQYDRLWKPQIDLGEQGIILGFRDLMEIRVASEFIKLGLSAQKVRQAILLAQDLLEDEHPLSTSRFKTDGRSVFLQVIEGDGQTKFVDLFKSQYAFHEILKRSLKNIEYDGEGIPARWWMLGKSHSIVIDPARSFGRPIEAETSIPAEVLASAATAEGSIEAAARGWDVPVRAVKRAIAFVEEMKLRNAA